MRQAAIFDLDGTLIPNASAERTFFLHMLRSRQLTPANIVQMASAIWSARGDLHAMVRGNKRYLRNKNAGIIEQLARNYFEPRVENLVFPAMKGIIEMHRSQEDLLLMLSGTLDVIAGCFVRRLGLHGYMAGKLEVKNGKYSGRITGILPYGLGKLEVLHKLRKEYDFDLNTAVLYANAFSDRYVMNAVHEPVAVNPDRKLDEYSSKSGWKIIRVKKAPRTHQH